MQGQLKFYEARVADMQREHKTVLQRLLPGASSAGSGEGGSATAQGADEDSVEQLRQRSAVLEAQVAALQKESDEKGEALEVKRRQQNESRLVLEEADSVIRQLEAKVKGLEDQNDRLREELKVRRAQQQPDEPQVEAAVAEKVQVLEKALKAERTQVTLYFPRRCPAPLLCVSRALTHTLGGAQSAELARKLADMQAVLTKKQRQTLALDSQASDEGAPQVIAGLQVRDSDVGVGEETAGSKRKSADGEESSKGNKKGKGKKEAVDECPLHLLEYMIPDDESYIKPSSQLRSGRAPPLSPSVANIKANSSGSMLSVSKNNTEGVTDTGKKVRKLFNANDVESAEALNEAAGSTLAEPTPMRRSTRSSRAGAV